MEDPQSSITPFSPPSVADPVTRNNFLGLKILVTGGTKGIGAAVARQFADAGGQVVIAARAPVVGSVGHFVQSDVSTSTGVQALADRTLAFLGGIDVLINNAGSQTRVPEGVLGITDEDWQRDLNMNLLSAVRLDRALLPTMIAQRGGVIIHVTSGQARLPQAVSLPYAAAKAALTTYSKGLANEVGRHGVRVNSVVPGIIKTAALASRVQVMATEAGTDLDTAKQQLVERLGIPIGRTGKPEDVAYLITFLASSQASFLTGSQYVVDGGTLPTV